MSFNSMAITSAPSHNINDEFHTNINTSTVRSNQNNN